MSQAQTKVILVQEAIQDLIDFIHQQSGMSVESIEIKLMQSPVYRSGLSQAIVESVKVRGEVLEVLP